MSRTLEGGSQCLRFGRTSSTHLDARHRYAHGDGVAGNSCRRNGKIYAIGGDPVGGVTDIVEQYDPVSDSWVARASLPSPRTNQGVATATNGKIYAISGSGGVPFAALRAEVYEYDPVANTWATKADNPTPRHSIVAASASNGKVYVFGGVPVGSSPYTCTGIVQEYDPTGDSWSTKTSMPTGRCGAGAAQATNGKIYVVGGTPSSGNPSHLATVEEYDPITELGDEGEHAGRAWRLSAGGGEQRQAVRDWWA